MAVVTASSNRSNSNSLMNRWRIVIPPKLPTHHFGHDWVFFFAAKRQETGAFPAK
jgi:hypothetical protein